MECVKKIKVKQDIPTVRDMVMALLVDAGCHVSSMPSEVEGNVSFTSEWELFDPEKVRKDNVDDLPPHWRMVYDMHMRPGMGDCRELRYRYVHAPEDIFPSYPKVFCRGIFCLDSRKVRSDRISSRNLIHIGDEFVGEAEKRGLI